MIIAEGVISRPSKHSVAETMTRVEALLRERGIKVFARIDHRAEAAAVGLSMPHAELLVFGNPKVGTALMLAAPAIAIDLPLKALAWQDEQGSVWLSYNEPAYLAKRFGMSKEQVEGIAPLGALIERATD